MDLVHSLFSENGHEPLTLSQTFVLARSIQRRSNRVVSPFKLKNNRLTFASCRGLIRTLRSVLCFLMSKVVLVRPFLHNRSRRPIIAKLKLTVRQKRSSGQKPLHLRCRNNTVVFKRFFKMIRNAGPLLITIKPWLPTVSRLRLPRKTKNVRRKLTVKL